jgi:hypothetical protein
MNRYADAPDVHSVAGAISLVENILADMRPWPEKVEIGDPEKFTGRTVFGADKDYALPRPVYSKLRQIADEIRQSLRLMHVMSRMPDLMIVMGDAATWIWDTRIAYIPREKPESQEAAP